MVRLTLFGHPSKPLKRQKGFPLWFSIVLAILLLIMRHLHPNSAYVLACNYRKHHGPRVGLCHENFGPNPHWGRAFADHCPSRHWRYVSTLEHWGIYVESWWYAMEAEMEEMERAKRRFGPKKRGERFVGVFVNLVFGASLKKNTKSPCAMPL